MIYNLVKTVQAGSFIGDEAAEAPAASTRRLTGKEHWHRWIERRPVQMLIAATIAILIGGMVEVFP